MSRKYFGTDGVRGKVGVSPITPDFVMHLGYAAGKVLAAHRRDGTHATVLIGKDTRVSGYMCESALEAGFTSAGVDVVLTGPMPTPAVAYLTRALRLAAGVVISASHNPHDDNGIKFFSGEGEKLPDAVETEIEAHIDQPIQCEASSNLGKVRRIGDAAGRYIEFCKSTVPSMLNLRGMKIVVDCAHGATYHVAPPVFHELGAEVVTIGASPNGFNINDKVGATSPAALQAAVKEARADLGIALDGDGDRLVMVDSDGTAYDGDQLLYVIAMETQRRGRLTGGVVGTLMSNLAFELALKQGNIPFARAKVGDRYVLEMLLERGWRLGGENSGHILCLDQHSTGDGIVAALQVLCALHTAQVSLKQACAPVALFPQVMINVPVKQKKDYAQDPRVAKAIEEAEHDLAGEGRVLLRPSGTEPVIRVMVEARSRDSASRWAKAIADAVSANA
ncbi:MAG: phosphoglucosamine mutase [Betaproteobacteria bacterium]|nr:phosphoglucosamine mutase [Betaproteobacteria bacterium]